MPSTPSGARSPAFSKLKGGSGRSASRSWKRRLRCQSRQSLWVFVRASQNACYLEGLGSGFGADKAAVAVHESSEIQTRP